MLKKFSKYEKMGAKLVLTTAAIFIHISLTHYTMSQKNVKFIQVLPKTDSSATNCDNQNSIKPCTF